MDEQDKPQMVSANIGLRLAGRAVSLAVEVPTAAVAPRRILPLAQGLADAVVDAATEESAQPVRCSKGCGACCSQLVPVSPVEARAIHAVVVAMDEPRRSEIVARFAQACRRTEEAGLSARLRDFSLMPDQSERMRFAVEYFHLGLPCPFLEQGACSIYRDRPLICREYLVTSDPAHCAELDPANIRRLPLGSRISRALPVLEGRTDGNGSHWLALIHVLEWVEAHPEELEYPGPKLLQALFAALSSKDLPIPPGLGADDD